MKLGQVLIVTAITSAFLLTYIISSGFPTGFATFRGDMLKVELSNIQVLDTEASLSWTASKTALSTLKFDNQETAFSADTSFKKHITGLEPGKRYDYTIRACDEELCVEKSNYFVN